METQSHICLFVYFGFGFLSYGTFGTDPCSSNGNVQYGISISGHTILEYKTIGFQMCERECRMTTKCRSIDFDSEKLSCQLKLYSSVDVPSDIVSNPLIWHMDIRNATSGGPVCGGKICQDGEKCVNDWCVYVDKTSGEWILIGRYKSNLGQSFYDTWFSSGTSGESNSSVESGCTSIESTATCTSHYRDSLIDDWAMLGIQQVKIEFYTSGVLVANITFSGVGSTTTSWLNVNSYLTSGWTDIYALQTFLFFSFDGDIYTPSRRRRLYIMRNHGGCENDAGWMVVTDGSATCDWERGTSSFPKFLYSQFTTYYNCLTGYEDADVMTISIKANDFP